MLIKLFYDFVLLVVRMLPQKKIPCQNQPLHCTCRCLLVVEVVNYCQHYRLLRLYGKQRYDDEMIAGTREPVYRFDHGVLLDGDVELGPGRMLVGGNAVDLDFESPYPDMRIEA